MLVRPSPLSTHCVIERRLIEWSENEQARLGFPSGLFVLCVRQFDLPSLLHLKSALFGNAGTGPGEDDSVDDARDTFHAANHVTQVDLILVRFQEAFQADPPLTSMDIQPAELEAGMVLQSMLNFKLDVVRGMNNDSRGLDRPRVSVGGRDRFHKWGHRIGGGRGASGHTILPCVGRPENSIQLAGQSNQAAPDGERKPGAFIKISELPRQGAVHRLA